MKLVGFTELTLLHEVNISSPRLASPHILRKTIEYSTGEHKSQRTTLQTRTYLSTTHHHDKKEPPLLPFVHSLGLHTHHSFLFIPFKPKDGDKDTCAEGDSDS
ncbi:hypothetical protein C4D60_Mb07t20950 [Musa balbisiana]|uniref:Uncharacterized protein n=1 Tax=Musa balbisiana TaxID=52838 RepID=A0A4S8JIT3_MUSBA|nr:hypothetical protein C4D60_Mb07t20950 [Musa balbisiana]